MGILANDYPTSPFAVEVFVALGTRHAMAQPLLVHGRLLGAIALFRREDGPEAFTPRWCGTFCRTPSSARPRAGAST